jgi:DNA invertase Pin-like site-specific DNA recombinase
MAESEKAPRRSTKKLRCAIYTRKSSEEGLDQAFNSLDAQREACAAFIQSQKHEGWTVSPKLYDDGGFSGGTLQRPALKRLLADIEEGQIDVIVVYKVDRLTRALSDFAKLVEIFDRRGASFVSITQQFNTTTSMGRLTLNVLLSFAQFEREVIGERVRDKIAASKKKGMWMGGMPSLGYDVKDRKLAINGDEARTVVEIYRRYLALKSVNALADELAEAGIRSKRRVRPDGTEYGGQTFSRGALYLMLQNRIYRGEITHKGTSYPGEHPAIIDQPLWDKVQAVLVENRIERAAGIRTKHPSLLAGLLFDEGGERLTPTYAVKKGTRYRYYVSTALLTGTRKDRSSGRRIPAGNLEDLVITRLRAFFADPGAVLDAVDDESDSGSGRSQLIERGHQVAEELESGAPNEIKATLMMLAFRVAINPDRVEINMSRHRLGLFLAGRSIGSAKQDQKLICDADDVVRLVVPVELKRVGREMRMLVENSDDQTSADPGLLRIIARAHDIQARLIHNTKLTVHDVAREERVTAAYVYTLLRLPWLAPDITSDIVNGRQPQQLNAKTLMRQASRLPADWADQRALLGFRREKFDRF